MKDSKSILIILNHKSNLTDSGKTVTFNKTIARIRYFLADYIPPNQDLLYILSFHHKTFFEIFVNHSVYIDNKSDS